MAEQAGVVNPVAVQATAVNVKPATKPAAGAAEGEVVIGTAGVVRVINFAITGKTAQTEFVLKHSLGTFMIFVSAIKEKGTGGSESTVPGNIMSFVSEVKLTNENECTVKFSAAPAAKEVYWLQVQG